MAAYTTPTDSDWDNEYETQADADILQKHSEITSDPDRHAKAHAALQQRGVKNQDALDASHKQMKQRVKHGLKKAFPKANAGETPFEKAGN